MGTEIDTGAYTINNLTEKMTLAQEIMLGDKTLAEKMTLAHLYHLGIERDIGT